MAHYSSRDIYVTFQVKLFEGTNTIEFQYKSIDAGYASLGAQLTTGIESRNY